MDTIHIIHLIVSFQIIVICLTEISGEFAASDDRNSVNCLCRQFGYPTQTPRSFAENATLFEGAAREGERDTVRE